MTPPLSPLLSLSNVMCKFLSPHSQAILAILAAAAAHIQNLEELEEAKRLKVILIEDEIAYHGQVHIVKKASLSTSDLGSSTKAFKTCLRAGMILVLHAYPRARCVGIVHTHTRNTPLIH
ncbi:hypothetical protein NC653_036251 [Populus alba x Populus x berolinensis]|uniref:Uncharacterized protein n=1 Tax=Populus alba x Populus x berolinensis TaxID=444605 RepID=A0AAD6PUG7_9ROSI|nr:hypothetical protein NC653_036251 [Populus alba x Populus x berolinensis]